MKKIVVIGTGLAGYTFARELRKIDTTSSVCLITHDDGGFYSKPILSNAIAKNKQANQIATASHEQMAEQLSARIITNALVSNINIEQNTLTYSSDSANSETIAYDELVLCLGAEQRDAGLGAVKEGMLHSVNNLTDYQQFREDLEAAKRISIVGTGLIGCEFANDIVNLDKQVTVVGPGSSPLANIMPQQIGHLVKTKLQQVGVQWRLGVKASALQSDHSGTRLILSDSESIDTDLVLSAIGLRPRITLAKDHGINVNKGIVVNDLLQTSVANIYALGDCAEINASIMPFVLPIMHCARVVAANMNAHTDAERVRLALPHMPIIVKTPACSVVALPPARELSGEWQISEHGDDLKGLFIDEDKLLRGFVLTGSTVSERQALMKVLGERVKPSS